MGLVSEVPVLTVPLSLQPLGGPPVCLPPVCLSPVDLPLVCLSVKDHRISYLLLLSETEVETELNQIPLMPLKFQGPAD